MAEDAQAALAAAQEPRAAPPGPDADALRRAYLDVLKLAVCDLVGHQTTSVGAVGERELMARELEGDARRLRVAGMDWPLHGLTMVGWRRLSDLQACVEQVVADGVEGDVIEAGSWRGGASLVMRATLDAHGDDRALVVADSFQGFPASEAEHAMEYDILVAPLEHVRSAFARLGLERGVELLPGFFEQTLAGLAGRPWALLRLDADSYEATRLALDVLYPTLAVGGYVVLDDYGSWPECRRAVEEFRAEHGITEPLEQIDFTGWRWRRASDAPVRTAPPAPAPGALRPLVPHTGGALHVPAAEELELRREVAALRERVAAAETAAARLRERPWRGPSAWLRDRRAERRPA
jgi:O-methyltransferase